MIARISILLFLLILLPDAYIYKMYIARRRGLTGFQRLLWWLPCAVLMVYTIGLCSIRDFAPKSQTVLNLYLLLLGLFVFTKTVFALCSIIGLPFKRILHARRNYGNWAGICLATIIAASLIYGATIGTRQLRVRHIDLSFSDLPERFDGYSVVHVSDIHCGSIPPTLLHRAIDSINAQKADAVLFTGDIENMLPSELAPFTSELSRMKAHDGVFSILGNHDYCMYIDGSEREKSTNEERLKALQKSFGWRLQTNSHTTIRRGSDSIIIAGAENEGRPPFPRKANLNLTLKGVPPSAFVIMMQHDPWAWEQTILPQCNAQLTLSGHTHGGQVSVLGWRPTMLTNKQDCGLYWHHGRALYVSSGLGGFLPFRLGIKPEIVVITLRKSPERTQKRLNHAIKMKFSAFDADVNR